jgi:manganese/iron transport system substrate-binding protein
VENIGGTRIQLEGVVPEGVNSHTFAPAPSVAQVIAQADLIVLNGLFLEEPTLEMAEANKRSQASILSLGEQTIEQDQWRYDYTFPRSEGRPNPHLWPDPLLALGYAELVERHLARMDPDNTEYYSDNLEAFRQRVLALDQGIRTAVGTIPPANRKLLTYHDSWAYFALTYEMKVIGAVQPSDFAEPSAREVAELIDQVRELGLPAVFGSEEFPSDVLETIAREGKTTFIDKLADDDLPGEQGDPEHSYLGLMRQNMQIMIPALGGNADAFADVDVSLVFEGESGAVYPQ